MRREQAGAATGVFPTPEALSPIVSAQTIIRFDSFPIL